MQVLRVRIVQRIRVNPDSQVHTFTQNLRADFGHNKYIIYNIIILYYGYFSTDTDA